MLALVFLMGKHPQLCLNKRQVAEAMKSRYDPPAPETSIHKTRTTITMEPIESDAPELSAEQLLQTRDQALAQIRWMRTYTLQLIDSIPDELWLVQPEGLNTHIAWQVGHLAVAEYGLMLFRQRGRSAGDMQLLPGWLRKKYGKGSTPADVDEKTATPQELRQRLDAIHAQTLAEVPELTSETLAEPTEMPYTAYPMKVGALLFCPLHESIHAGQIGLLRRAHGLEPLR